MNFLAQPSMDPSQIGENDIRDSCVEDVLEIPLDAARRQEVYRMYTLQSSQLLLGT